MTLFAIFAVLSVLLSACCAVVSLSAAKRARAAADLPRKLERSDELRVQSLHELATETATELERLANKVKMQKVRNVTEHGSHRRDEPDPHTEPDRWRTFMNAKIQRQKMGIN